MPDPAVLRKQFPPLLEREPFIYLDSAATALKPQRVIDAVFKYLCDGGLSVRRSLYQAGIKTTARFEDVRRKAAAFIKAPSPDNIIFIPNATFGIALSACNLSRLTEKKRRRILIPLSEHHSNLLPWKALEAEGFQVETIPLKEDGSIDYDGYLNLLDCRVAMVAAATVTNVTGVVNDLNLLCREAQNSGALFLADNAQGFPRTATDITNPAVDFMVCSGHKAFAPPGSGMLYGKSCHLKKMHPLTPGGGTVEIKEDGSLSLSPPPHRLEGGTPDISAVLGLGAAIDFMEEIGIESIARHEKALLSHCRKNLESIGGVQLFGPADPDKTSGIVSFMIKGWDSPEVCRVLDKTGKICVRGGYLCAGPQVRLLNPKSGVVRVSFGPYNTIDEIDLLSEIIGEMAGI